MVSKRPRHTANASTDQEDEVVQSSSSHSPAKKVRWNRREDDADCTEEDAPEKMCKSCLAVWHKSGWTGCAYYDPDRYIMYILEDTQDSSHFDLVKMVIEQCSPDVVLTSSKTDEDFIDVLRESTTEADCLFQIKPFKDFTPSKGRDRILSLSILSDLVVENDEVAVSQDGHARNAYEFMRKQRAVIGDPIARRRNALIRLANFASVDTIPICMASIGALLDYLIRQSALENIDGEGEDSLSIRSIETLSLDQVMHVNADTLSSLQIFERENHASVHSDKTKEGLSLYGILDNTRTRLGRSLMRAWLLRPSLSITEITGRQDAVACFLHPENLPPADAIRSHLKGISNVPRLLRGIRIGKATLLDWQGLLKFSFHSAMIRDVINEFKNAKEIGIVQKLHSNFDAATVREVGSKINKIIDWEESVVAGRVCVRQLIDEELDHMKRVYNGIDFVLTKVAEQISEKIPPHLASSLNVVYFPQLGFLICVPSTPDLEANSEPISGWCFQFSSDAHLYFKSPEMRDMDNHIGDLHSVIVDREIDIIQQLSEEIVTHEQLMNQICDIFAELDCLLSFAEASRLYDYRRPEIVEDNIIRIKQGRHPLQEQIVDTFVPNDTMIAGGDGEIDSRGFPAPTKGWNSILVCTGANACGKSVYLKQIALIQYMAQIGCFVPAESAVLGVVDKIFTRISTHETVSKVQSAFMIDLNQVSLALRNCTVRSLIILDEFGKGTLTSDGAGLFCGILKHLIRRGRQCPKVLVATHFHEVFKEGLFDPSTAPISFCHMQIVLAAASSNIGGEPEYEGNRLRNADKITYLYHVAEGLSLESHAAVCAEFVGVPAALVQRARYVSNLVASHELGRLLDEDMTDEERRELEDAETVCRRFLEWDFEHAEARSVTRKLAEILGRLGPVE